MDLVFVNRHALQMVVHTISCLPVEPTDEHFAIENMLAQTLCNPIIATTILSEQSRRENGA